MTEHALLAYIQAIPAANASAADQAKVRQAQLAKPPGSLGRMEEFAIRLAGITGRPDPFPKAPALLVFAADNGVVEEGVSITPASVTRIQSEQMTRGKTGMSAMAAWAGFPVLVTDVGICGPCDAAVRQRKVRPGTGNIATQPAMSRTECLLALAEGIYAVEEAAQNGHDCIGIGEMGIGNTTTSAALLCALTDASPEDVVGRGSGLTDSAYQHKCDVVSRALHRQSREPQDIIGLLADLGGLDLAAMTGAFLACARHSIPAVADGFISDVAALCAVQLCPRVRDALFLAHRSAEPGAKLVIHQLGLEPMLDLGMRLGEGSGCVPAMLLLQAACAAHRDMATFEEAVIDDAYLRPLRGEACP